MHRELGVWVPRNCWSECAPPSGRALAYPAARTVSCDTTRRADTRGDGARWEALARKSWALPVTAAYAFYVAFSHIVWSETSPNGNGWAIGLIQAAVISIPGFGLLWLNSRSRRETSPAA